MLPYLFDIAIVLILAFFAWRGAKKGLILSLCGLVGIFVAFFGAQFLSNQFYQPLSGIVEPAIYQAIVGVEPESESTQTPTHPSIPGGPEEEEPDYSLDELLDAIREAGLFAGLSAFLDQAAEEESVPDTGGRTAAQGLADYLSQIITKAGLFALSFVVILLIWFLVGHILDLAFHLPILAAVNLAGGLILGLVKAILLVIVLVWAGQLAGLVPAQPETPVLSLFTLKGLGSLLDQWII